MSLKLCFNDEIHRVSKLPVSISALNQTVASTFPNLSGAWSLRYDDSEGDRITLKTDDDLKNLYAQQKDGKSIKIIVWTANSVDRKYSIASDKSFEVVVQNVPVIQPNSKEEQKVSDITGDKVPVPKEKGLLEEKNWMRALPVRVMVFKLHKKILQKKLEGANKERIQKEIDEGKAKFTPEDQKWFEQKIACLDENGVCQGRKGSKSKDKNFPPKKEAKKISKKLFFQPNMNPEEKKALEARLVELEASLTQDEKDEISSKQAKWAEKAEKKKEKRKKFAQNFHSFLKENLDGVLEVAGHKHDKHHGAMKKLSKELLETYKALPEEKQVLVSSLLNGIPEKMIALKKEKDENKKAFKEMTKEQKHDWKAKKIEERIQRQKEKAERKESKSKSKGKRESKSPLKDEGKTPNPILRAARKFSPSSERKLSLIKEIFPDIDIDQAKSFIDANKQMSADELIQSMLTSTVKK